jgi:hypothetical protein
MRANRGCTLSPVEQRASAQRPCSWTGFCHRWLTSTVAKAPTAVVRPPDQGAPRLRTTFRLLRRPFHGGVVNVCQTMAGCSGFSAMVPTSKIWRRDRPLNWGDLRAIPRGKNRKFGCSVGCHRGSPISRRVARVSESVSGLVGAASCSRLPVVPLRRAQSSFSTSRKPVATSWSRLLACKECEATSLPDFRAVGPASGLAPDKLDKLVATSWSRLVACKECEATCLHDFCAVGPAAGPGFHSTS